MLVHFFVNNSTVHRLNCSDLKFTLYVLPLNLVTFLLLIKNVQVHYQINLRRVSISEIEVDFTALSSKFTLNKL